MSGGGADPSALGEKEYGGGQEEDDAGGDERRAKADPGGEPRSGERADEAADRAGGRHQPVDNAPPFRRGDVGDQGISGRIMPPAKMPKTACSAISCHGCWVSAIGR